MEVATFVEFEAWTKSLQSRTGPEQGFPCVVFPHREKPGFITGMGLQRGIK